jgi:uncharacterized membrane protein
MIALVAAAAVFVGLHLMVSGTPLRGRIVGKIGETPYMAGFALSVLASLGTMCWAYGRAYAGADNVILFDYSRAWRNGALPAMLIAFLLAVPGILRGNPTTKGQETAALRGALRITRHPFLWGVAIWAGFHLVGSGDLASLVLFGAFFVLAVMGTRSIDAKTRKRLGPAWADLAAVSSNLPFAAILQGRNRFVAKEYFDWRFWTALGDYLLFLYIHAWLFGLSPFPNDWLPSFDPLTAY